MKRTIQPEIEKKTAKPILSAKNITKTFHDPKHIRILDDVTFEIFPGESVAIMGRSGEGKSTLLHLLGLLDKPDQGSIHFFGSSIPTSNPEKIRNQSLGFIFQSFHLLDNLSSLENILIPAKIARQSTKIASPAHKRGIELLNLVGLEGRESFSSKLLSGGEKQRVAIARALCNDPDIILADEPTGNLDSETSDIIEDLLFSLCKKTNKTLIIVTHDSNLAQKCSKQLVLQGGKLLPLTKI